MKTIAESANDFQSIRTLDKGICICVDKTDYFSPSRRNTGEEKVVRIG